MFFFRDFLSTSPQCANLRAISLFLAGVLWAGVGGGQHCRNLGREIVEARPRRFEQIQVLFAQRFQIPFHNSDLLFLSLHLNIVLRSKSAWRRRHFACMKPGRDSGGRGEARRSGYGGGSRGGHGGGRRRVRRQERQRKPRGRRAQCRPVLRPDPRHGTSEAGEHVARVGEGVGWKRPSSQVPPFSVHLDNQNHKRDLIINCS